MNRLLKISQAYSKASGTYDSQALIQSFVAQKLAAKIFKQEKKPLGTVLEIGCGTGILSTHLANHSDTYVLTDISLPLLKKAQTKMNGDNIFYLVTNGEQPCFSASFDLIVTNLVLHWFQEPKKALAHLVACLKPGGRLYISTFGNNTFHEWRSAHTLVGAPCGVLDFTSFGQLKDWLPLSGVRQVEEEWMMTSYGNALNFLRHLKASGGYLAHPGHRPLPYKIFKEVMKIYDENPKTSYQILYGSYKKPEKIREE